MAYRISVAFCIFISLTHTACTYSDARPSKAHALSAVSRHHRWNANPGKVKSEILLTSLGPTFHPVRSGNVHVWIIFRLMIVPALTALSPETNWGNEDTSLKQVWKLRHPRDLQLLVTGWYQRWNWTQTVMLLQPHALSSMAEAPAVLPWRNKPALQILAQHAQSPKHARDSRGADDH